MLDVHDDVAQAEEVLRVQRLGEEVGEVVVRVDEWHAKTMVLDALADVEGRFSAERDKSSRNELSGWTGRGRRRMTCAWP